MPCRLLRDGAIVADEWTYVGDADAPRLRIAPVRAPQPAQVQTPATRLLLPFEKWQTERERWRCVENPLGIVLLPVHRVEDLAPELARFELIAAEFPGPSEGRGYTQARLLRERYAFKGELRATGYVRYDQIFFLARCGFNSFELPEAELARASAAFKTFSARYQISNDIGLAGRLRHR